MEDTPAEKRNNEPNVLSECAADRIYSHEMEQGKNTSSKEHVEAKRLAYGPRERPPTSCVHMPIGPSPTPMNGV